MMRCDDNREKLKRYLAMLPNGDEEEKQAAIPRDRSLYILI
jgi:hypothetical protein